MSIILNKSLKPFNPLPSRTGLFTVLFLIQYIFKVPKVS
jgi:hypothetical protein